MRTILERRGDGTYVRIPKAALKAAKLRAGEPVTVRERSGAIVIEPLARQYDLKKPVAAITPQSLRDEVLL